MKISEAFDMYIYNITIGGKSRGIIDHSDYVKRKFIEIIGDKDLDKLTLKDVY